jgi:hypothetical protein
MNIEKLAIFILFLITLFGSAYLVGYFAGDHLFPNAMYRSIKYPDIKH